MATFPLRNELLSLSGFEYCIASKKMLANTEVVEKKCKKKNAVAKLPQNS